MQWHEPCQEEIDFVQELLEKFLVPELDTLKQISAENTIPRLVYQISMFLNTVKIHESLCVFLAVFGKTKKLLSRLGRRPSHSILHIRIIIPNTVKHSKS